MERFWQVCELEDSRHSFIEYTVAAVPEIWIVQLYDGSYICYWPKVNPAKKIREFIHPNVGGIWITYKCRILMNQEKFSSYEVAREAEKYSENFSLKEDSLEEEVSENVRNCDSTMSFEVSNDEKMRNCDSTMDFEVSEASDDDEMIVGNDSYNFNKAILRSGLYCSEKLNFTIEDDSHSSDESVGEKLMKIDTVDSEISDYSTRFELNNGNFLTSTLLPKALKEVDNPKLLAKISFIETSISSFVNIIRNDFHELKDLVKCNEKSDDEVQNVQCMTSKSDQAEINSSDLGMNNLTFDLDDVSPFRGSGHEEINHTKEYEPACPNEEIPPELNFQNHKFEILSIEPVSDVHDPSNALAAITAAKISEDLIASNPTPTLRENGNNETFVEKPEMMKFPVPRKEDFKRNEDLLNEAVVGTAREDALIAHLLPDKNEDEVQYMNRTILTVFTEDFFIESVSFKPEKDVKRLFIGGTNILNCWKASYETQFGPDDKNKKFIAHFRRFKGAKSVNNYYNYYYQLHYSCQYILF